MWACTQDYCTDPVAAKDPIFCGPRINSYPIVSYRILSYPIVSYRILSYPIVSYRILSYPIVSYRILSYPIVSYRILSYPIVSYRILSVSCRITSSPGRTTACTESYLRSWSSSSPVHEQQGFGRC